MSEELIKIEIIEKKEEKKTNFYDFIFLSFLIFNVYAVQGEGASFSKKNE